MLFEEGIGAGASRVGGVGVSGLDMLVKGIPAVGDELGIVVREDGHVGGGMRGSRGGCFFSRYSHFKFIVGRARVPDVGMALSLQLDLGLGGFRLCRLVPFCDDHISVSLYSLLN